MITHGFFGKLPGVGDFVSRGWLTGAREGLDRLLQQAMAPLLTGSPDGKALIAQAPRLALSIRPGVIGDQGVVTVVLPSQDRVGRVYPLCAGVQWTVDDQGGMGWPSLAYGQALTLCVQRAIACADVPDRLLSDIVALGSPRQYAALFQQPGGGEETVPRLGAETHLLRLRGPQASLSPALQGLCAMLSESSDLLGLRLDAAGEVADFFVCRRFDDGAVLASMFDGRWAERGWTCFGSAAESGGDLDAGVSNVDEDATRPRQRTIDTALPPSDSPSTP